MHDIRHFRESPESRQAFDDALARRGHPPIAEQIKALDDVYRSLKTEADQTQAIHNRLSKAFGQAKAKGDEITLFDLRAQIAEADKNLAGLQARAKRAEIARDAILSEIPNLPAEDVPDGENEEANELNKEWWPKESRAIDFTPKEHADIAPVLGMDFETGAKLSGARFTFLRGGIARLHRALGQFMLDVQTGEHGYIECNPPLLVKNETMHGTGQLPKFKDDSFATYLNGDRAEAIVASIKNTYKKFMVQYDTPPENISSTLDYEHLLLDSIGTDIVDYSQRRWLIPTAEVSLTNSVRERIIDDLAKPIRLTALTPCFRSEAGSAGRDTRGFIRQHQFEKCELVSIARPEDSEDEHERMTNAAETILQRLELHYRKMLLCTGDMGFGARKTYDLEVWLPGQGTYREISSCSNMGDFQARRMNTRYRVAGEKRTEFVHTLNGSGLAVGRTLVAVIENYQNADGSVTVPDALLPYMGGVTRLEPAQ